MTAKPKKRKIILHLKSEEDKAKVESLFYMIIVLLIMITLTVALLPHIVYVIVKVLSLLFHFHIRYAPFAYTALGMVGVWLCLFAYGNLYGRFFHETKDVEIPCNGLPDSFKGYRIVHLSDLHLDGYVGNEGKLLDIVRDVNAQKPDLICFTGDLISIDKSEMNTCIPILKQLKAKDGIVSVMGNHDYMPYNRSLTHRQRWENVAELQRMEREQLGWKLLLNENIFIRRGNDSIAIAGCENQSMGVHSIIQRGNLSKALAGTEDCFRIILTHDPTHWKGEILQQARGKKDGTLTLAGHTHAGQFRLFGFSVARFIYDEYEGLYSEGHQHLYINIGLGGTMPMRIGATPEVTLITLK